jgi:hypothetical protein
MPCEAELPKKLLISISRELCRKWLSGARENISGVNRSALIDSHNALDDAAASIETIIMDGDALSRCRLNLLVACRPQEEAAALRLVVVAVEVDMSSADAIVEGPIRMSAPHDDGEHLGDWLGKRQQRGSSLNCR